MEQFTGGARFGWANASWPLATLSVNEDAITIRAALLGEHTFKPEEVIEVRRVNYLPLVGSGVQVVHTRTDVPRRIIFWSFSPGRVLEGIARVGFRGTAPSTNAAQHSDFPLRPLFAIGVVVIWNALFLLDRPWAADGTTFGPGGTTGVALLLIASLWIRRPGWFQDVALKHPDELARIGPVLNIVTLVSVILLIASALLLLS